MKKEFILFILILLIPSISAIEISIEKSDYQPQETLQVEITGNFISLKSDNFFIYKENIDRPMPIISDFTKQNNTYYYYAILPNQEGNFSLKIKDSQYTHLGELKTEDIIKDFTINKTNQTFLEISPGFIITDKNFSINIKSPYRDVDITTTIESTGETNTHSLPEFYKETLDFSISEKNTTQTNLKITTENLEYNIPIFITGEIITDESEPSEEPTNETTEEPITNETEQPESEKEPGETIIDTEFTSCSDLGRQCNETEKCNEETVSSLEGPCCPGECKPKTQGGGGKAFLGILILLLVLGALGYLFWKAKKKQIPKSVDEILKSKTKKFKKRMKKKPETKEVSKSLGKV